MPQPGFKPGADQASKHVLSLAVEQATTTLPLPLEQMSPSLGQPEYNLPLIRHMWALCKDTENNGLSPCFYAPNRWPEFLAEYWAMSLQK